MKLSISFASMRPASLSHIIDQACEKPYIRDFVHIARLYCAVSPPEDGGGDTAPESTKDPLDAINSVLGGLSERRLAGNGSRTTHDLHSFTFWTAPDSKDTQARGRFELVKSIMPGRELIIGRSILTTQPAEPERSARI